MIFVARDLRRLALAAALLVVAVNLVEFGLLGAARAVLATVSGRLVPVYFVATAENKIAFTFERGAGTDRTLQILRILEEHGAGATFFFPGEWIGAHPEVARAVVDANQELGNHTYSAPHVNSLSNAELRQELERAHEAIEEATGQPPRVFRPPYGEYSNKVIEVARDLGYETVVWSTDSLDWRGAPADDIRARVLAKIHKGSIVRFHTDGAHTVEALPGVISELEKLGYDIVPVSSLLIEGGHYVDPYTGEQRPARPLYGSEQQGGRQ